MLVTRRQIAKGAAWTLPVVVVGVAAPASSASTTEPVRPIISIESICKTDAHNHGGGKLVHVTLWFGQPTYLVSVTVAGITGQANMLLATADTYTAVAGPIPSQQLSGPNTPVSVTYTANGGTHYTEDVEHGAIPDCCSPRL